MAAPKNQQDGKLQQKTLILSLSLSLSLFHVHGSVVDFFLTFFFSLGVVRETGPSVLTDPKNRRDFNLRDVILLETEEQMS